MMELNNDDLKSFAMFESCTGVQAADVLITESAVVFLVSKEDMGKAIGSKGANITRVRQAFGRQVLIFEDNSDMEQFLRALFAPIPITNINVHEKMNSKTVFVTVDESNRGAAIGKGGDRIKIQRALLQRKFNCDLRLVAH